jgi:hypothetical protein
MLEWDVQWPWIFIGYICIIQDNIKQFPYFWCQLDEIKGSKWTTNWTHYLSLQGASSDMHFKDANVCKTSWIHFWKCQKNTKKTKLSL